MTTSPYVVHRAAGMPARIVVTTDRDETALHLGASAPVSTSGQAKRYIGSFQAKWPLLDTAFALICLAGLERMRFIRWMVLVCAASGPTD